MLGYLAGPAVGSTTYSVVHTDTLPVAVGGVALWFGATTAVLVATVWAAHIGADRLSRHPPREPAPARRLAPLVALLGHRCVRTHTVVRTQFRQCR